MCCCDLDGRRGPLSLWMALIEIHLPQKSYKSSKMLAVAGLCADFIYVGGMGCVGVLGVFFFLV